MSETKFGEDPFDTYSVPTSFEELGLVRRFEMPLRADPARPGRSLTVLWDERNPAWPDFRGNSYDYLVRFTEPGGAAGNHYHRKKQEIFFALGGVVKVIVEDIHTKQREEYTLTGDDNTFLCIEPPLAHAVVSQTDNDMLLVIASHANVAGDEFPYQLT